MSNTKIQENKQKFKNNEENLESKFNSKLISKITNSFKFLFIPKSRIERFQVSGMQY